MRFSKILITCVLLALATSCNKEDEFCSTQSTRPSSIETVSAGVYDFFNRCCKKKNKKITSATLNNAKKKGFLEEID